MRKKILRLFDRGNVCVTGLRGTGKDMLLSNVVARRKRPYISNVDYHVKNDYIPLYLPDFDVKNSYSDFITGSIRQYVYPYPDKVDLFISDAGVYFPSQYCNELNKKFERLPYFMALSRHLGDCNVHFNVQNLNRCWDKIREQSDTYIRCVKTIYIKPLRLVLQRVIVYDDYDACIKRVKPFKPLSRPLFQRSQPRSDWKLKNVELKRSFDERNGSVKAYTLIYFNRSKYDTRFFNNLLRGGKYE